MDFNFISNRAVRRVHDTFRHMGVKEMVPVVMKWPLKVSKTFRGQYKINTLKILHEGYMTVFSALKLPSVNLVHLIAKPWVGRSMRLPDKSR